MAEIANKLKTVALADGLCLSPARCPQQITGCSGCGLRRVNR